MNNFVETILNRKSVRSFINKPVEKEKIDLILHSAMSAPSARNRQPWKFIVIDERGLLDELGNALPYAKMLLDTSLGIIVCGDLRDKEDTTAQSFWVQDCSAATENILLAIQALGLGACWTGCYPREDRQKIVKDILNLPEGVIPLCVIPIGYSEKETPIVNKWNEDNIWYNQISK